MKAVYVFNKKTIIAKFFDGSEPEDDKNQACLIFRSRRGLMNSELLFLCYLF
jgi:hypothetical protein